MIIFDLDGTLADCEHRLHFVDPTKSVNHILQGYDRNGKMIEEAGVYCNIIDGKRFKPNWKEFFEACDKDNPINPVIKVLWSLQKYYSTQNIHIWSNRSESVRNKTVKWIDEILDPAKYWNWNERLKMRPPGDLASEDVLKERWLDEALSNGEQIRFVVDDCPKSVRMWRRRGIFVFDVNQSRGDF